MADTMTEPIRDVEAEFQEGEALFDARLAALRAGTTPQSHRRAAVQRLAEEGATEGERAAARAALERLEEAEYMDAVQHGAA